MKKNFLKIKLLSLAVLAAVTFSCSNDGGDIIIEGGGDGEGTTESDLSGNIAEDTTLDTDVAYALVGSLYVKSGSTLTIPAGTRITANKGTDVFIVVEKGAEINIAGTASNPVVMTSANETPGDWGGLILLGNAVTSEGVDATAEVGGFKYGGTNNNDSSGSINYLIINYAGAQINAESQYNGLTLYSVGSGTSIQNVAMLNGTDDGVEFFGGSVSPTNMYFENNQDDSVDWTEGWSGTLTNAYILHTEAGFSTAFEGDGTNNNPKFVNVTAVSTQGGTALQFKKESGATITGLSLTGYETSIDMKDDGDLANVIIEGEAGNPDLSYIAQPTVDIDSFFWVASNLTVDEVVALSGDVTSTVTLDASKSYLLDGSYIVQDGGKLIIPAGTKITAADGGTSVYIAVLKGGLIDIQGTADNPVVMSSQNAQPRDWGGLTICGEATTSEGVDATAEVGGFIYGGTDDEDSSGSIKNLVILGTGAQINSESQYNGVSFYAVGSRTTVENVAVINGADDGVEFFGGTVSATNLYFENDQDDSVDWTEGWNGTLTNVYISHTEEGFSTAFEGDGTNNNPKFVNVTAISTQGGTALQFKKESGATITNLYLGGYDTNIDMKDSGPLSNVLIDGAAGVLNTAYDSGTQVDISTWTWIEARL
ncbi:hypothetical protein DSM03_101299 [Leeuwenhoekiella aestuarii]|uniref:Uncharacterized protein n=1 Tax=Leeuwenhoekiella aestuarii TaxID=2249426 RepID=A0A4Q0NT51_9FLAO|nr:hypothetical protein [Leeuwenhoekiella aestuarii]RXG14182.1 hypothetical protein DSM04_104290 [Leeuwenhoekiella aestuarii]RXG18931.1 hypothetical protein DSM03_101299 [Leeuwenhoekiella aestuarii]